MKRTDDRAKCASRQRSPELRVGGQQQCNYRRFYLQFRPQSTGIRFERAGRRVPGGELRSHCTFTREHKVPRRKIPAQATLGRANGARTSAPRCSDLESRFLRAEARGNDKAKGLVARVKGRGQECPRHTDKSTRGCQSQKQKRRPRARVPAPHILSRRLRSSFRGSF